MAHTLCPSQGSRKCKLQCALPPPPPPPPKKPNPGQLTTSACPNEGKPTSPQLPPRLQEPLGLGTEPSCQPWRPASASSWARHLTPAINTMLPCHFHLMPSPKDGRGCRSVKAPFHKESLFSQDNPPWAGRGQGTDSRGQNVTLRGLWDGHDRARKPKYVEPHPLSSRNSHPLIHFTSIYGEPPTCPRPPFKQVGSRSEQCLRILSLTAPLQARKSMLTFSS